MHALLLRPVRCSLRPFTAIPCAFSVLTNGLLSAKCRNGAAANAVRCCGNAFALLLSSLTAMQVASRIWCLWGIVVPCASTVIPNGLLSASQQAALGLPSWANINFITLMTAWACSEVIRYGFFALKEAFGTAPYFATWLRCVITCLKWPTVLLSWSVCCGWDFPAGPTSTVLRL
jgi:hypothetical protein